MFLIFFGFIGGFIDSIAGGGGLIGLPVLTMVVGPGAHAIGTNKIVGTVGALVAFLVYLRRGHVRWKDCFQFSIFISIGSFIGSRCTPLVPAHLFKWFLLFACPLILWISFKKDLWIAKVHNSEKKKVSLAKMALAGTMVGFYDGFFGPGGGTFMFLALLFIVEVPLLAALAASKFANTVSAGTSLLSFWQAGYVHPREGFTMAIGMTVGALIGANLASQKSTKIVRPILVVVAVLLLVKLFIF